MKFPKTGRAGLAFTVGPATETCIAVGFFAVVAILFFITSPKDGDFVYSDSPRHALNGVFVLDLLRDLPFGDPVRWAYDYYLRYPALTILFYPPMFSLLLAPFYAVLGVSQSSALVLSAVFTFALGVAVFVLARRVVPPVTALAAGLVAIASPETAYWARMVMLDVPAIAILAWAAIFTLRFCERDRTSDLAVLSALFVSALYTKQQMAFLAPGLAAVVVWMRGLAVLREKRIWLAAAISVAALVPLAVINLKFARFNVEQAGTAVLQQGHGWWNDWGYYVGGLPAQLGWPLFLSGLLGLALVLTGRSELHHRAFFLFMVGWIVLCYLMFSPIAVKSLRFTLPWVIPWSILGAYAVVRVGRQYGKWIALVGAVGVCIHTLAARPVDSLQGIGETVAEVIRVAPRDSNVLFSGKLDGAFIFEMRSRAEHLDLSVIRADKMLLNIRVSRDFGLDQRNLTDEQIVENIKTYGIKTIVHHMGYWTDVPMVARFEALLHTPGFVEQARIPLRASFRTADATEMVIYRVDFPVADGRPKMPLEIGLAGLRIK